MGGGRLETQGIWPQIHALHHDFVPYFLSGSPEKEHALFRLTDLDSNIDSVTSYVTLS